jgi:hypothetical protein
VHRFGIFGARQREHFHLGELVDAKQPLALAACCTGFGAEAVRDAGEPDRKLVLLDDGPRMDAPERDLGGADQAQILPRERVDLGFLAARIEADAFENGRPRQVGGARRVRGVRRW